MAASGILAKGEEIFLQFSCHKNFTAAAASAHHNIDIITDAEAERTLSC